MKPTALLCSTVFLMNLIFFAAAGGQEPPLVSAVVRELTYDPNSAPLENRNVPGMQPPSWTVRLEILKVLRGDSKLEGQPMITATADSQPDGSGRFVTPKLNEGDVGIWAIKQLEDGSWAEVYSPYEVEKGIRLPLIKGRNATYEKVLSRLSGGEPSQPINDAKFQDETPKPGPTVTPSPPVHSPTQKPIEAKFTVPTPTAETKVAPSSGFPIVPVAIVVAVIVGVVLYLPRRKST